MILARVAVAKSSRSAASSEDLSGTFYRACRKTAPRTGAVSSLSDLCSPHDAYAPCPLLAGQRLASHRLLDNCCRATVVLGTVPGGTLRKLIWVSTYERGSSDGPAKPRAVRL